MGKLAKQRGSTFEREVVSDLARGLGRHVERNLGQARDGGDDITLPRAAPGELPGKFRIECKRRRSLGCEEFMRQAEAAAAGNPSDVPVVIMRGDGCKSLALVRLEHFLPMLAVAVKPCDSPG